MSDRSTYALKMYKVITTFKKLMLIFLGKQGFVCQVKMRHISEVDLLFTEMNFKTLTSEFAMALPYTLKMIYRKLLQY